MLRKPLNFLREVLLWIFWLLISAAIILFAIGLINTVWPNFAVTVFPASVLVAASFLLMALAIIVGVFSLISYVRGAKRTILDVIEWWDNLKDRKKQ